ncbi:MAG TPA: histidine kinase dimerization/phospho-acceptor domain-containing protein, partial [Cellvibrionaceae bacterium]|nr:histidine kinase dimerization/phospho-acceptor domain-containing protein [Cellvibrionaceae bacterium]
GPASGWDFTNLAMILMLASTLAAVLLPIRLAAATLVVSVLAFDWLLIEPRGSLVPHLQLHLWFWVSLTAVNGIVLALMAYLRQQLASARQLSAQLTEVNQWHQVLLESHTVSSLGERFLTQLAASAEPLPGPLLLALKGLSPAAQGPYCLWGPWQLEQLAGVEAAEAERRALGPGTGCYERWQDLVLPILGRKSAYGALVLPFAVPAATRRHWQLLCHQLGGFYDRRLARQKELLASAALEQERTSKAIIAAVSHDFRTPLATIIGASSSLLAQELKLTQDQQQAQVQRIYQQAQHLARVSQNLLQLARLGSDVAIARAWEDPAEMLGSLLAQLPFRAQVQVQLPEAAPWVWCNSVLINQALANLLENAHQYGPKDAPIQLRGRLQAGLWLWQVQDGGTGLSAEQAKARQRAFERGEEAAHPSGVGLGLALCEAIARAHQGALSFNPQPSSTWQLQIPQPPQPAA